MANLIIDNVEITAKEGDNLLWTALENGFYIPNLCSIKESKYQQSSCRLCFVEIKGNNSPVTACTQKIVDGMQVYLDSARVRRIRKSAFELLLSHHHIDCSKCSKNRKCELHHIASKLRLKLSPGKLLQIPRSLSIDNSHPLFFYDPNKCVLCGKCVYVCRERGSGVIDFAFRGISARISTFSDVPFAETECNSCLACVSVCPVGSLILKTPE